MFTNKQLRQYGREFGFGSSTVTGWIAAGGPPETTRRMLEEIARLRLAADAQTIRHMKAAHKHLREYAKWLEANDCRWEAQELLKALNLRSYNIRRNAERQGLEWD